MSGFPDRLRMLMGISDACRVPVPSPEYAGSRLHASRRVQGRMKGWCRGKKALTKATGAKAETNDVNSPPTRHTSKSIPLPHFFLHLSFSLHRLHLLSIYFRLYRSNLTITSSLSYETATLRLHTALQTYSPPVLTGSQILLYQQLIPIHFLSCPLSIRFATTTHSELL